MNMAFGYLRKGSANLQMHDTYHNRTHYIIVTIFLKATFL